MQQPDICTSLNCSPPKKYCPQCSHAIYRGVAISNGKEYPFEFSPQYGVTFMTSSGEPRKVQPGERNKVWYEFEKWYKKFRCQET